MFKKLHSNRDPRDTVISELRKEFSVYFNLAGKAFKRLVCVYPKLTFGVMVFLMSISLGLSFTIFRNKEKVAGKPVANAQRSPVRNGFSKLLETGAALKQSISLKRRIDSLTAKQLLNAQDSLMLERALDELSEINKHLNQ